MQTQPFASLVYTGKPFIPTQIFSGLKITAPSFTVGSPTFNPSSSVANSASAPLNQFQEVVPKKKTRRGTKGVAFAMR
jgi:hypothetical protein